MNFGQLYSDIVEILRLPKVSICLMHSSTKDNDPFYARIVKELYAATQKRHRKMPFFKAQELGLAICELPANFDDYFMYIAASGRRNYKKAARNGYECVRINFNDYIENIREIRQSTDARQGELPEAFVNGEVEECENPQSETNVHDYPYFGVIKDGVLKAYAGCFIAGEVCMIEHIYGHAEFQTDGVVPMLIIGMAKEMYSAYPNVKYYGYGSFYGAGETMRRFKKKFKFLPHKVKWCKN